MVAGMGGSISITHGMGLGRSRQYALCLHAGVASITALLRATCMLRPAVPRELTHCTTNAT
jgi:hypothetical protein